MSPVYRSTGYVAARGRRASSSVTCAAPPSWPAPRGLDAALGYFRAWGAEGGKIAGKSRMSKLTREQRRALARKADCGAVAKDQAR
jgi:hypothetical protein